MSMSGWWSRGGYVTEGCIDQHLAAVMDEDEDVHVWLVEPWRIRYRRMH